MFLAGRSAVFTLITPGEHNWRLTSCEVGTCAPMLLARVQAKKRVRQKVPMVYSSR